MTTPHHHTTTRNHARGHRPRPARRLAFALLALLGLGSLLVGTTPASAEGEYDNPAQGLQPATGQERSTSDLDGDGLPQRLEFELARQFMPTVWFHENEGCGEPAGNRDHAPGNLPGQLVFRANRHPSNPDAISIQYVLLFARDCGNGSIATGDRHNGDAEPFSLTLVPNAACRNGYGIYAVRTWAHEGTGAQDINNDIHTGQCRWGFSKYSVNHDRPDGRIFTSWQKHAIYLDATECNLKFFKNNGCKKGWTAADVNLWKGLNVGEPNRPLASTLEAVDFSRERVWGNQPFCGNLGSASNCPGPLESKFNRLFAAAPASPTRSITVLADGSNQASAYVVRVKADGSQSTESLAGGVRMGSATDRVFLVLYTRALGTADASTVSALVNGLTARASYAGPSGYEGVEQVNVELPRSLADLHGNLQLQVRAGTRTSGYVTVPFA